MFSFSVRVKIVKQPNLPTSPYFYTVGKLFKAAKFCEFFKNNEVIKIGIPQVAMQIFDPG